MKMYIRFISTVVDHYKRKYKNTTSKEDWDEEDYNKMQLNNKDKYTLIYVLCKKRIQESV